MNRPYVDSSSRQRGFTLIELLIALAISAVISVMAYQAISQVVNLQTRTEAHAEQFEAVQRALWWLEQDVVQMAPRSARDGLGDMIPAFSYRQDLGLELTRIAQMPTPYGQGGLMRVGYQLEGDVLYRLVWPVMDRAPDSMPQRLAILHHVERFEVRLLNAANQFVNTWPDDNALPNSLPNIVELQLKLAGQGAITRLFMGVAQ
ncbi:type II secretion system minor pseudopilin GspJ [Thiomicrorhabdus cannonii]|uniref:type II secretion system minor pseudopilin GspJ n=1 Tax=Thiomicrorhabdus cannonii TaxID=2748011 RepID=UPI0015B88571|nr:type II secretion system minor pseudopilin GspJ [Thiomicrorhabdus cannonii]